MSVSVRILIGDCREKLRELPDASVNCCVTSPPYFGLRDYGTAEWEGGAPGCEHKPKNKSRVTRAASGLQGGIATVDAGNVQRDCHCGARRIDRQMGLEPTPDEFVAGMVEVFREVRRVLRDDGVLFLNIGDSYASQGGQRTYGSYDGSTGRGSAPAQRVGAYGKRGKAPEGSLASDCFCRSLCGACREAYRIGKSHSARSLAPKPSASSCGSIPEHTGSPIAHLPTLDSARQDDHSAAATPDLELASDREGERLPAALASTTPQSSQPHSETCSAGQIPAGECRLCARSLADCVLAFGDRAECICDSDPLASADRNQSRDASGLAYPSSTTESLKPKDLIGIPWLLAFALRADGWFLRQDIIWSKPNPMPESVRDRCTKAHEYLFLLSKSERYFYDQDAIAEPLGLASVRRLAQDTIAQMGSDRVPGKTNGPMKAVGRRAAGNKTHKGATAYEAGDKRLRTKAGLVSFAERERAKVEAGDLDGTRNKRSVWEVATQPFSEAHFATYPPALIEPCILAGCPKGGTVLDPFGGAGTTGLVADRLQRDAILIELNPEYAEIARKRIASEAGMFGEVLAA